MLAQRKYAHMVVTYVTRRTRSHKSNYTNYAADSEQVFIPNSRTWLKELIEMFSILLIFYFVSGSFVDFKSLELPNPSQGRVNHLNLWESFPERKVNDSDKNL